MPRPGRIRPGEVLAEEALGPLRLDVAALLQFEVEIEAGHGFTAALMFPYNRASLIVSKPLTVNEVVALEGAEEKVVRKEVEYSREHTATKDAELIGQDYGFWFSARCIILFDCVHSMRLNHQGEQSRRQA